jgi:UDP-N-acetylmuramoyl-tripeptide--D-alanyl-D-alanine ligase
MAELGRETDAQHRLMTERGHELGVRVVGYDTELYGPDHVEDLTAAVELVRSLGPEDAVLFKGSRVTKLEEVVRAYGEAIGDPTLVA